MRLSSLMPDANLHIEGLAYCTAWLSTLSLFRPVPCLSKRLIHTFPPLRSKMPYGPNNRCAAQRPKSQNSEKPSITDCTDQWRSYDRANTGQNVPTEIVNRNAGTGLFRHKLREHCSGHGENQHAAYAIEEIGYHLSGVSACLSLFLHYARGI